MRRTARCGAAGTSAGRAASRIPVGARIAAVLIMVLALSAHVGTDDVFFAGRAGPWPVRVTVVQPGVIPGLADVTVRVEGDDVERVLVTALRRIDDAGEAPPPDEAQPVAGTAGLYSAQLWLMVRGPHSVIVTVEGARGRGEARIPVMARATRRLAMTRGLETFLLIGGLFLVVGMISIVGTAARESGLDPGRQPGRGERRRARLVMGIATLVIATILFGGWTWIRAEADLFGRRIDRPWSAAASVAIVGSARRLDLAITDSLWIMRDDPDWLARNGRYRRADLIADHGKLMHMILVREPEMDAFAHVHPVTEDENTFRVTLPPLPAGRYRVYGDLAHEDGSARTLAAHVDLPAVPAGEAGVAESGEEGGEAAPSPPVDPDDAWWTAATASADAGVSRGLDLHRLDPDQAVVARTDTELGFEVTDASGRPVPLEPYMGMRGHAMLDRNDGQVFLHLHPVGMISMGAMEAVTRQAASGDVANEGGGMEAMGAMAEMDASGAMDAGVAPPVGAVHFPFVAPSPGSYRMWVQVKVGGRVLTRAFDLEVG